MKIRALSPNAAVAGLAAPASLLLLLGAGAARQQPLSRPDAPPQDAPAQTCAGECHQEILSRRVMHGPAQRDCEACHVLGDRERHTFFLINTPEELCVRCHAIPQRSHTHAPARDGACMDCHDPHGSDHPAVLVADPRRELCATCHQPAQFQGEYVHGPVVLGACVVCHEPHASAEPALLRQSERETCLSCHAEVLGETEDEQGVITHTHAALDQGCSGCHDPHASDHRFQLRELAPRLCMTCHEDQVQQTLEGAKVVHGAVLQEGGCNVCHEPHRSRLPNLQRATQPKLCLDCHNRPMKTDETGAVLANMASLLEHNPDHHGPIREGSCTACHSAHSADRFRLLIDDYPPDFYAPFKVETFSLCFKCHIPDLVLKDQGRGLTQFRDGDTNLHWLHVNQEKGRTCRACHEVHASRRPAHVREAVPFGSAGWMLEINFEQTSDGGVCTPACHQTKTYERRDGTIPSSRRTPAHPGVGP